MILEIVSPEATLFKGDVTAVTLPGIDGSFQLLDNHAPIVSILKEGEIKIAANGFNFSKETASKFTKVDEKTYTLAINSGTLEMNHNRVIVLVD